MPYTPPASSASVPDMSTMLAVPTANETIPAGCSTVVVGEYVMDASHELIFSDPSEMAVI